MQEIVMWDASWKSENTKTDYNWYGVFSQGWVCNINELIINIIFWASVRYLWWLKGVFVIRSFICHFLSKIIKNLYPLGTAFTCTCHKILPNCKSCIICLHKLRSGFFFWLWKREHVHNFWNEKEQVRIPLYRFRPVEFILSSWTGLLL